MLYFLVAQSVLTISIFIVILGMRWRAQQVYGVMIVYFRVPLVIEVWHRDKQLSQDVMIGTGELPLDRIVTTDKFKVSVCICLYIQLSVRCTYLWRIKISCQNYEIILHARWLLLLLRSTKSFRKLILYLVICRYFYLCLPMLYLCYIFDLPVYFRVAQAHLAGDRPSMTDWESQPVTGTHNRHNR